MTDNVYTRSGIGMPTSVNESARSVMVRNTDGKGFVFTVDDKKRLTRFLILGTEKGTYYAGEKPLTKESVTFLVELIKRDRQMVIDTVKEISTSGRAYHNSQAIFVVAVIAVHGWEPNTHQGQTETITDLVLAVCRTSTHLFEFADYLEMLGGWSRTKCTAVARWYTSKSVDELAYQVVKYRQRNGRTHRDMLRLSHPSLSDLDSNIAKFILGKDTNTAAATHDMPRIIEGFRFAQEAQTSSELINLALTDYPQLPWEAIPTQFHKDLKVWQKLFDNGQIKGQALLRNITRFARLGAFDDMVFAHKYNSALVDEDMMRRTRLHPFQYLLAMNVHSQGQAVRGNHVPGYAYGRTKDWTTSPIIMDALDDGFNKAFRYVEPAGKRTMVGLDVSSSMTWDTCGSIELQPVEVAAAMAVTIMRTEPYYQIYGFASDIRNLNLNARMSVNDVMSVTKAMAFGSTNPSALIRHAHDQAIQVDTFIVITDNEVNTGTHPYEELLRYRRNIGIPAKLIVVACTPTPFTIADPNDSGMLDISGADSNLPTLIADFSAGRI